MISRKIASKGLFTVFALGTFFSSKAFIHKKLGETLLLGNLYTNSSIVVNVLVTLFHTGKFDSIRL